MPHVLFVEPDKVLANTFCRAAISSGYTATSCATAQEALICADEVAPDVVVLELQLVVHSGIEFLYEFHSYSDWQNVPVIINSYVPASEFVTSWELLKNGLKVCAYYYKPHTNLSELFRGIGEATAPKLLI
jgi:DNA-binding response OmpR family regulator